MTATVIDFTIPKLLWLTSNRQIPNRAYRAKLVRDLQALAVIEATRHPEIAGQVRAHWLVCYPKGVRLDKGEASNAQPTTKALLDGIVRSGLLEDDGPAWVLSETFERGPNLDRRSDHTIRLTLTTQDEPSPKD